MGLASGISTHLNAISLICTMLASERRCSMLLCETRKPYDGHCRYGTKN
jgi:hypothetical protein